MSYTVTTDSYSGPLDTLLQLVETKKLDITTIHLAHVTGDFLDHVARLQNEEAPFDIIADFLVVASKLVLIKATVLLPTLELDEEETAEIQDLELQLKLHKQMKSAEEHLRQQWRELPRMGHRDFLMHRTAVFYPPELTPQDLLETFARVADMMKQFRPHETVTKEVISLKSTIASIISRITHTPTSLTSLAQKGSKKELITLFLAILHLFKESNIEAEQHETFGDIVVAKRG